ncbi:MATE family efflux transporter [Tessaracoccus caeni]|uniref:MATE family efflux transporter n=1 Tax=Tessaracoccus caeni TaxID=3031239 RepID=UPI0023DCC789|nr:MATE family efflux transporter [Tessaracoccus caeni]MDF1489097.1 MATE family efflux transporter [Tessaracoccus caeni]
MTKTLTVGSPVRVIVLFAIPLLLGNVFQQIYHFTDAVVVGRLLGVNALAAVGSTSSVLFLLLGFTFGAAGGMAIPVARSFGAGDMVATRRFIALGTLVSVAIAAVVTVAGTLLAEPLLTLMRTPPELMADATIFLLASFWATPATMAFNYVTAVIRALGDSRTPLIFLIACSVLNAGLVFFFIGAAGLGVGGAALATAVAQLASAVGCSWWVLRRTPALRLVRADWRPVRGEAVDSVRPGLALGFQMSVIAIGAVVLQQAINGLGPDAVAAATTAMRIDQLAIAALSAFGVAMVTFTAQNHGAREWGRIRQGVWQVSLVTWGLALVLGLTLFVFGAPIAELFTGAGEPAIVRLAHDYLTMQALFYPALASLFVLRQSIQGLGATLVPTLAGFMELVFRAAVGLLLVGPLGFLGVTLAAPLAWVGALVPLVISWVGHRRRLIALQAEVTEAAAVAEPELAYA